MQKGVKQTAVKQRQGVTRMKLISQSVKNRQKSKGSFRIGMYKHKHG